MSDGPRFDHAWNVYVNLSYTKGFQELRMETLYNILIDYESLVKFQDCYSHMLLKIWAGELDEA